MVETRTIEDQEDIDLLLHPLDPWPGYDRYKRLDRQGKEIRLLRIWHEQGQIHGTIEHSHLDCGVEYEALSYAWGAPSKLRPVYLNGKEVHVRAALWNFLDSLCQHQQTLPVWLDALCINQKDLEEKDWQVCLMGEIYSQAMNVLAWIGDTDADSNYTIAFLNQMQTPELTSNRHFKDIRTRACHGAWQLMQRPYWKRLWIVQEVLLAKCVTVVCGPRRVSLRTLKHAVDPIGGHEILRQLVYAHQRVVERPLDWLGLPSIEMEAEPCDMKAVPFQGPEKFLGTLLGLMALLGDRLCGDPRDKILALRSLAKDRDFMSVSYRSGLGDLLFEVVRSHVIYDADSDYVDYAAEDPEICPPEASAQCFPEAQSLLDQVMTNNQFSFSEIMKSMTSEGETGILTEIYEPVSGIIDCKGTASEYETWTDNETWHLTTLNHSSGFWYRQPRRRKPKRNHLRTSESSWWCVYLSEGDTIKPGDQIFSSSNINTTRFNLIVRPGHSQAAIVGMVHQADEQFPPPTWFRGSTKALMWFLLLKEREIAVCKRLLRPDYGTHTYTYPFRILAHYSRLAMLALSVTDLQPLKVIASLRTYRSSHPLQILCPCDSNVGANDSLLQRFNQIRKERRPPQGSIKVTAETNKIV